MEDFSFAGGMGAVLRELKPLLNLNTMTVTGQTLGYRLAEPTDVGAPAVDRKIIASMDNPQAAQGGLVALFGTPVKFYRRMKDVTSGFVRRLRLSFKVMDFANDIFRGHSRLNRPNIPWSSCSRRWTVVHHASGLINVWPRYMDQIHGPDAWPRCMAQMHGPDAWPRCMAQMRYWAAVSAKFIGV